MPSDRSHTPTPPRIAWCAAAIAVTAAALRIPGLFTDLWLDEIWAARIAQLAQGVRQVFTDIHFDTNHWVYTIYLHLCGSGAPGPVLRLLSYFAGLVLLWFFWRLRDERAGARQLLPLLLAGSSFLLAAYASEARGYALLMAAALLSHMLYQRWAEAASAPTVMSFWAACVVGLLSHLTFVIPFADMGLHAVGLMITKKRNVAFATRSAAAFALPVTFLAWLYVVDIRHIRHGGTDDLSMWYVFGRLAADVFGMPNQPWALVTAGSTLTLLIVFCLYRQWQIEPWNAGFYGWP